MVYVCDVCGYIYDDSVKTKAFDELPESWKCPVCGADKDAFSPKEEGVKRNEGNT